MSNNGRDRARFFETLSRELDARSAQVRQLIGDRHWLSDGHHKEALLRGLLSRHLPHGIHASRGFILGRGWPEECSREQDIILLNTEAEAPLFRHGDLVITLPDHVLALISVKTTFGKREFVDAVEGLLSACTIRSLGSPLPWSGVYFFNEQPSVQDDIGFLAANCVKWLTGMDLTGLPRSTEWCFRVSADILASIDFRTGSATARLSLTRSCGVSSAFFVAQLVDSVADSLCQDRSSFAELADLELAATEQSELSFSID